MSYIPCARCGSIYGCNCWQMQNPQQPYYPNYITTWTTPAALSSPRCLPVNVPLPEWDSELTIVTVDKAGNVSIKTSQPKPEPDVPAA